MCSGGKALSTASFPQTHRKNPRQAVPMCIVAVGSQLISSISLSLCESRPGVAESNHRHGRGAEEEEEVAQIAPSQKAAQANCKIARTLPRVTSDQNSLQQLARMWCTVQCQSDPPARFLACVHTPVKLDLSTCNSISYGQFCHCAPRCTRLLVAEHIFGLLACLLACLRAVPRF